MAKKAKTSKPKSGAVLRGGDPPHEHDEICACDFEMQPHEETPDHELPPARGGVEGDRAGR